MIWITADLLPGEAGASAGGADATRITVQVDRPGRRAPAAGVDPPFIERGAHPRQDLSTDPGEGARGAPARRSESLDSRVGGRRRRSRRRAAGWSPPGRRPARTRVAAPARSLAGVHARKAACSRGSSACSPPSACSSASPWSRPSNGEHDLAAPGGAFISHRARDGHGRHVPHARHPAAHRPHPRGRTRPRAGQAGAPAPPSRAVGARPHQAARGRRRPWATRSRSRAAPCTSWAARHHASPACCWPRPVSACWSWPASPRTATCAAR